MITLMSVAAKVMGKVLIRRISDGVDVKLRKEQAGFCPGRSTVGISWNKQSTRKSKDCIQQAW